MLTEGDKVQCVPPTSSVLATTGRRVHCETASLQGCDGLWHARRHGLGCIRGISIHERSKRQAQCSRAHPLIPTRRASLNLFRRAFYEGGDSSMASWRSVRRFPLRWAVALLRRHRGISLKHEVPISAGEVLQRARRLPLAVWTYDFDDPSVRHMGPMAQDFAAAFGLGDSDRTIHSVDALGVALACIQTLANEVDSLRVEVASLHQDP